MFTSSFFLLAIIIVGVIGISAQIWLIIDHKRLKRENERLKKEPMNPHQH